MGVEREQSVIMKRGKLLRMTWTNRRIWLKLETTNVLRKKGSRPINICRSRPPAQAIPEKTPRTI